MWGDFPLAKCEPSIHESVTMLRWLIVMFLPYIIIIIISLFLVKCICAVLKLILTIQVIVKCL